MRLIVIVAILVCCGKAFSASGEIYFGGFIGSGPGAAPGETSGAEYIAGVMVEEEIGWFYPFIEVETLIDKASKKGFHPSSVEYGVGGRAEFDPVKIEFVHRCQHPIDKRGEVQQYNLIRAIYGF